MDTAPLHWRDFKPVVEKSTSRLGMAGCLARKIARSTAPVAMKLSRRNSHPVFGTIAALPARADKPVDPVRAEGASERPAAGQVMRMGERLAQSERHLMPVEGPPEQDRQQLHGALWAFARSTDLVAAG